LRISRYLYKNQEYYGILNKDNLISLPILAKRLKIELPHTLSEFINQSKTSLRIAEALLRKAEKTEIDYASVPLNIVQLQAPITFPPKIICLGLNYADHVAETNRTLPEEPVLFMKPHTAIIGPNQKIIKRPFVKELDYEGELAIIIGKKAKDVPVSEAENYIFGYTIFNDVSARDFQYKDKQWVRAKSFDTFAPTGPCITTKNQMPDVANLNIRTWVNNELRQNGSTKDMIFNINQIIYHISRVMTLEPCDIIATGTPSGVGMAMNPKTWLKNGDIVRIQIEGIGTLENQVEER
jgi:2-keto-4-pentenoate hydratase/2-oxohepta-3-ene-1,7-dioic acid hydratase in catechol pathway